MGYITSICRWELSEFAYTNFYALFNGTKPRPIKLDLELTFLRVTIGTDNRQFNIQITTIRSLDLSAFHIEWRGNVKWIFGYATMSGHEPWNLGIFQKRCAGRQQDLHWMPSEIDKAKWRLSALHFFLGNKAYDAEKTLIQWSYGDGPYKRLLKTRIWWKGYHSNKK